MIERRLVKNDPVSIRNLHNLARLDNMDNQAASRYVDQQPLRMGFDGTRCGQDVIGSQKKLRQLPDRLLPGVTETQISHGRVGSKKVNRRLCSMSSNLEAAENPKAARRTRCFDSEHDRSPKANCTYVVLR